MFEGSATMPSLRKSFGTRLRAIRRTRDLSQEHFAEVLGISVDFLSLVERGINSPSFDTLEQIAERLRVPVKDLFDFPQERPSK
jgi:transcriptional regulator with XRE-family HTH domain